MVNSTDCISFTPAYTCDLYLEQMCEEEESPNPLTRAAPRTQPESQSDTSPPEQASPYRP